MKKISLPLLGAVLLLAACQKTYTPAEEIIAGDETAQVESSRKCASQEVLEEQIKSDPKRAQKLEELERYTETFKGRSTEYLRPAVVYIPVVVNVVMTNPDLVTDAQIDRQLDVLTKDFTKSNSELSSSGVYLAGYPASSVANCQVVFYISNRATDVRRKTSTTATFGSNDAVKKSSQGGLDPSEPTIKLNMWVCDLSNGLLGYAQFPGGAAATDGVVIDYQAFGTLASYPMYTQFNLGRTATHEVGHWVNLRHIWGDARCGNDFVGDTPAHDGSNGGCPSNTLRSACSGKPLEQWMNYMDYTDDRCMYMFTTGQKTRMDAALDAARVNYVRTSKI